MILATLFLLLMFIGLLLLSWHYNGWEKSIKFLGGGYRMLGGLIPLLLLAFIVAGFIEVILPPELVQGWLGNTSGIKGDLLSYIIGALLPGGPYVTFPIIGAIYKAGAGLGAIVTMVTAWSAMSIGLAIFEIAFVGPRFTAVRMALMFWIPIAAGILAHIFFA